MEVRGTGEEDRHLNEAVEGVFEWTVCGKMGNTIPMNRFQNLEVRKLPAQRGCTWAAATLDHFSQDSVVAAMSAVSMLMTMSYEEIIVDHRLQDMAILYDANMGIYTNMHE